MVKLYHIVWVRFFWDAVCSY